jgi:hypothetical protein
MDLAVPVLRQEALWAFQMMSAIWQYIALRTGGVRSSTGSHRIILPYLWFDASTPGAPMFKLKDLNVLTQLGREVRQLAFQIETDGLRQTCGKY